MRWYVPSWNGDIRFESLNDDETLITVIKPTAGELAKLAAMERIFYANGWASSALWDPKSSADAQSTVVKTPILEVAKRVLFAYTTGDAVLTAIRFANDEIRVVESGEGFWRKIAATISGDRAVQIASDLAVDATPSSTPYREPAPEAEVTADPATPKPKKTPKKPAPKAAATVKKPTSCCPNCVTGPMAPEKEVLFAFLTEDERAQWADDHSVVVVGGLTGHRYLLSHRNGMWAERHSKICRDLDDDVTLHFHDNTVPPEEEVLAAKLILEHRENWLRHEASFFGNTDVIFANPFGDGMDGTRSAAFSEDLAATLLALRRS